MKTTEQQMEDNLQDKQNNLFLSEDEVRGINI